MLSLNKRIKFIICPMRPPFAAVLPSKKWPGLLFSSARQALSAFWSVSPLYSQGATQGSWWNWSDSCLSSSLENCPSRIAWAMLLGFLLILSSGGNHLSDSPDLLTAFTYIFHTFFHTLQAGHLEFTALPWAHRPLTPYFSWLSCDSSARLPFNQVLYYC